MNDITVQIRVKNGRLLRAIRSRFGNAAQCARYSGVSTTAIYGLLSMQLSPVLKSGEWSEPAFSLSSALDCEPEDLWPDHIKRIKLVRSEAEIDASVEDIAALPNNVALMRKVIVDLSAGISPRDLRAISMQSEGATLDEIGAELGGVTRERARQMCIRAERKMRINAARKRINFSDVTGGVA